MPFVLSKLVATGVLELIKRRPFQSKLRPCLLREYHSGCPFRVYHSLSKRQLDFIITFQCATQRQ